MKILIAEDDATSRLVIKSTLVKLGYEVIVTRDGDEAWKALQSEDAPSLAILDWMMPGMDGIEVCQKVRNRVEGRYTYILLLTSNSSREDIIKGIDAGADDYMTKPLNANELKVRLRAGRRILDLQSKLLVTQEELLIRATHDSLTKLWNRAAILEALSKELSRAKREKTTVGVAIADIDNFKLINDTYGHQVGDDVIQETARRLKVALRPYDSVGRYGGEEFLIVLANCSDAFAFTACERVRRYVCDDLINVPEGKIKVTISMGVALSDEGPRAEPGVLIRAADLALYRAKNAGRNMVFQAPWDEIEAMG